jgi:triphosphoribosyl-dephospho-CoA synthase
VTRAAERIAAAFRRACVAELKALKPGNVHVFADGHRMTVDQFMRSADAAAPPLCAVGARVGRRVLDAVEATVAAVGTNTNLGIILLCAPLAAAADTEAPDLRAALGDVLDALDTEDAALAFRAIVRAAPAGLGRAERNDVFAPARVTLRQAMAEAADRDRIARQYVTGYADIFDRGLPLLAAATARGWSASAAVLAVYLGFVAAFPDSHVVRKYSLAVADEVRNTATKFHTALQAALEGARDPAHLTDELLAWDAELKARAINPGTSADLTVATLFVGELATILPSARNSG